STICCLISLHTARGYCFAHIFSMMLIGFANAWASSLTVARLQKVRSLTSCGNLGTFLDSACGSPGRLPESKARRGLLPLSLAKANGGLSRSRRARRLTVYGES